MGVQHVHMYSTFLIPVVMDASPEPALVEKISLSPSLSGVIHNRVTTSNSQHRLRAATKIVPTTNDVDTDDVQVTQTKTYTNVGLGITSSNSSTALLPAPILSGSNRGQCWSFTWGHVFRWILTGYCCFSVLFFAIELLRRSDHFILRFKTKLREFVLNK